MHEPSHACKYSREERGILTDRKVGRRLMRVCTASVPHINKGGADRRLAIHFRRTKSTERQAGILIACPALSVFPQASCGPCPRLTH